MRPCPLAFPAEPPRGEGWEWFHIILTAYGQWLHGDPRGFRTKHHREHIEGDYQHPPPPGAYEARLHRSKSLKSFPAQVLTGDKRPLVGRALLERYAELGAFVACAAVARKHIHLLVKLPGSQTRQWTGQAKLHA